MSVFFLDVERSLEIRAVRRWFKERFGRDAQSIHYPGEFDDPGQKNWNWWHIGYLLPGTPRPDMETCLAEALAVQKRMSSLVYRIFLPLIGKKS